MTSVQSKIGALSVEQQNDLPMAAANDENKLMNFHGTAQLIEDNLGETQRREVITRTELYEEEDSGEFTSKLFIYFLITKNLRLISY